MGDRRDAARCVFGVGLPIMMTTMHTVGHHDLGIQIGVGEMVRDGLPALIRDLASFEQVHRIINDVAR